MAQAHGFLKELATVSDTSERRLRRAVIDHYDFVWRTLRRLGVVEASVEDAVQHVLVILSRRIDDVPEGAERAFMVGTAARVASDYRKQQARRREDFDSDSLERRPSLVPSAEEIIDRQRARELLDHVLAEMPDDLRIVFVLFEFEDLTMAEIASLLEIPAGTVASRLRRARQAFEAVAARFGDRRSG